jgi:hypothetical protein
MQIDSLSELGSEKQPPEQLLWSGSSEELNKWLKDMLAGKKSKNIDLVIDNVEE